MSITALLSAMKMSNIMGMVATRERVVKVTVKDIMGIINLSFFSLLILTSHRTVSLEVT